MTCRKSIPVNSQQVPLCPPACLPELLIFRQQQRVDGLTAGNRFQTGLDQRPKNKGQNMIADIDQTLSGTLPRLNPTLPEREWWVVSTAVCDYVLMLVCNKTGAAGIVREPSEQEWSEAFFAPSNPYRWHDNSRVEITCEGKQEAKP